MANATTDDETGNTKNGQDKTTGTQVDVDPRGDVFLEMGGPNGMTRLRVSSKVLSLASTVFDTMFTSSFLESLQHRGSDGQSYIPLPEDDKDAMLTICEALHYRSPELMDGLGIDCVVQIGALVDKYDLARAVRPWGALWLRARAREAPVKDLGELLSTAYQLEDEEAFSEISFRMICHRQEGFESSIGFDSRSPPANARGRQKIVVARGRS